MAAAVADPRAELELAGRRALSTIPLTVKQALDGDGTNDAPAIIGGYGVAYGLRNRYGRVFVPGAFNDSLQSFTDAKPLPIGWMHELPIGKWTTLRDTEQGPYLEGPLSDTTQGRDASVLARDGLTALSIGFDPFDATFEAVYAEGGTRVQFETPYGTRSYQFDEWTTYIVTASIVECSMVLVGVDDDARLTTVQSLAEKAERAFPGASENADWNDVAYSMALLMGGRGASSFQDLPDPEHRALYERLCAGYTRHGKTPPPYDRRPEYQRIAFQHDERLIFHDRYLRKQLAGVNAGAGGIDGPLSDETRAEAERAIEALQALTQRTSTTATFLSTVEELAAKTRSLKENAR